MTYEEVHKGLIDRLRLVLGIIFPYSSRLDLFRLRNEINWFSWDDKEVYQELIDHIDKLVEMRIKGMEPEHKDGRYV